MEEKTNTYQLQSGDEFMGIPRNPRYGTVNGKITARLDMEVMSGPLKGRTFPYAVDKWTQENMKFAIPRLQAAGWRGKDTATFEPDIKAFAAAGVAVVFKVKLAENPANGSRWWTVDSIGTWSPPLKAATADDVATGNDWLAQYNAAIGESESQQTRTAPVHGAADGMGSAQEVPVVGDDDIPFVTCSMTYEYEPWPRMFRKGI